MSLVGLLIFLLILCVFFYVLNLILNVLIPSMGLPASAKPIIMGIIGLIVLLIGLNRYGYLGTL